MPDEPLDWSRRHDKVIPAFESGTVVAASDQELLDYLRTLCTGNIQNPTLWYRETIRGQTINYIQMRRLIERLDRQNQRTVFWFMVLAVLGTLAGIIQVIQIAQGWLR
jgi:hypothetical protein